MALTPDQEALNLVMIKVTQLDAAYTWLTGRGRAVLGDPDTRICHHSIEAERMYLIHTEIPKLCARLTP